MTLKWLSFGTPLPGSAVGVLGSFNARDLATITTPIAIPNTGVFQQLTNDALRVPTTEAYAPPGISPLWDTDDDCFYFTELSDGDHVHVRGDLLIDVAGPNTEVLIRGLIDPGGIDETLDLTREQFKTAGVKSVTFNVFAVMVPLLTAGACIEIQAAADGNVDIEVRGWEYLVNLRA